MFFKEFAGPGIESICDLIVHSPSAVFYKCVAQFAVTFVAVEKTGFELSDG
jgi:hypothetical protein